MTVITTAQVNGGLTLDGVSLKGSANVQTGDSLTLMDSTKITTLSLASGSA